MGFSKRDDRSCCSDDSGSEVFRSVPKNTTTFCVWRIEGLRAISVARNKMGMFLSESAYIIYTVTSKDGNPPYPGISSKEVKDPAVRCIHFWIGSSCDATISGAAALRAAELDALVSATILLREAQGRESPRFLAYFRHKLVIENIHQDRPTCTLHRVTGLSMPILTELNSVRWENFSSRDVILIDLQSRGVVFLWLGSSANSLHKKHAWNLLESTKENNGNRRIVVVDDGYEQTLPNEDRNLLNSILDLNSRTVVPEHSPGSVLALSPVKLYRCSEQSGKYKVAEVKSGPIFRSDLSASSVFLIDRGEAGVWAWVGSDVNAREKLEAVRNARGFVKKKGYSPSVPVARAVQGQEPTEMRSLLRGWGPPKTRPLTLPPRFEPDYMAERPRMAAECQLVDDGSARKTIWRVNSKNGMIQIENKGIYYAETCYVMRYEYGTGRRSRVIIYYWEGAHSTSMDREAALESACNLAEDTSAQLVKASQGREPAHLLQIYAGKLIILAGPHRDEAPKKYLVRVLGSTPYTSKAVERPLRASSLDSSGVFVLFSNCPAVWCGGRSTGDAREASRRLAPAAAPLVVEGKEDDEFWTQIGGRGNYGTETTEDMEETENHLYHCHTEGGAFLGEEILGFTQSSLLPEAAWLLDAGNVVWVWLGKYSVIKTLRECIDCATTFLYTHPAGRDRNTSISVVRQGVEPPTFIGLFENWNHNLLRDHQPFESQRLSLQDQERIISNVSSTKSITEFDAFIKYPFKVLKSEPDSLPRGVDVARKEMHLTFDDFMTVFKMEPTEFEKLPAWRRQRLKQAAGLF
ncbi:villin-1 isoform X2 [Cephus cinctus]|uniref:Villin-1 isoform X2 n=1 Tax=Cephus cinctus TaxID=211228 RepID=A0AAJ7FVL4_CEPCN|nr:villin-1 isoform X2 [Cephus cinctus]